MLRKICVQSVDDPLQNSIKLILIVVLLLPLLQEKVKINRLLLVPNKYLVHIEEYKEVIDQKNRVLYQLKLGGLVLPVQVY